MGKKTPVHVEVKARHRDEPVEKLITDIKDATKIHRINEDNL